jgi:hypothetical protein
MSTHPMITAARLNPNTMARTAPSQEPDSTNRQTAQLPDSPQVKGCGARVPPTGPPANGPQR